MNKIKETFENTNDPRTHIMKLLQNLKQQSEKPEGAEPVVEVKPNKNEKKHTVSLTNEDEEESSEENQQPNEFEAKQAEITKGLNQVNNQAFKTAKDLAKRIDLLLYIREFEKE